MNNYENRKSGRKVKVSILVYAYNVEKYLDKCIWSILQQTESNFELLIVNDGSTDHTREICQKYQESDERIRYLEGQRESWWTACSMGIRVSEADFLIFVNGGDWIEENYVERLYETITASGAELAVCDYYEHLPDGRKRKNVQKIANQQERLDELAPACWAKIWKKKTFLERTQSFCVFLEDIAMAPYLLLKASKIAYVSETSYHFCKHQGGTMEHFDRLGEQYRGIQYILEQLTKEELLSFREELIRFVDNKSEKDRKMLNHFWKYKMQGVIRRRSEILNYLNDKDKGEEENYLNDEEKGEEEKEEKKEKKGDDVEEGKQKVAQTGISVNGKEIEELVSIIVPVYNVEKYIDKCVETLIHQTYPKIEILLINDGSTDHSWEKCVEWGEKDSRIRIFKKENEGLGETRNFGVRESRGSYIMYVDSDDWVDERIVEKLLDSVRKNQSDISICDRYQYSENLNQYELICHNIDFSEECFRVLEYRDCILGISAAAWGKLYKKSLLVENKIQQPSCEMEDIITPVTMALAEKISYVREPLYIYRYDRSGSITNNLKFLESIEYLRVLLDEFKKRGLYEKYETQVANIIKYRGGWNYNQAMRIKWNLDLDMLEKIENYRDRMNCFLKENNIPASIEVFTPKSVCVIGSYNLMIAAKMLCGLGMMEKVEHHYSYSSLISMMAPREESLLDMSICGKNSYRTQHIASDFCKTFQSVGCSQMAECNIILVDFLEERFSVGRYGDTYITLSDAYSEASGTKELHCEEVSGRSKEYLDLWKESCDRFIQLLERRYQDKIIVLVKMKLTSRYGSHERLQFFDWDVKAVNDFLEVLYQYFEEHCPRAAVVEVEDSVHFYTDGMYRHGVYPWHLNTDMYREIRKRIRMSASYTMKENKE